MHNSQIHFILTELNQYTDLESKEFKLRIESIFILIPGSKYNDFNLILNAYFIRIIILDQLRLRSNDRWRHLSPAIIISRIETFLKVSSRFKGVIASV